MAIAPITLLVLGIVLLGVAVLMSAMTMHAVGYVDDPPIACGSLIVPHHLRAGDEEAAAFAKHKCDGQRSKRVHRVALAGGVGIVLCAGSIALRRRDKLVEARTRHDILSELEALRE